LRLSRSIVDGKVSVISVQTRAVLVAGLVNTRIFLVVGSTMAAARVLF
jgi:hypothetical protein